MSTQFVDPRARWDQEAIEDLCLGSARQRLEAWAKWSRRAAEAKGETMRQQQDVGHLRDRCRDAYVGSLASLDSAFSERMRSTAPMEELERAEVALAKAVEAEDFAGRVCRALERPRAATKADEKPKFGVQQGGKRA